MPAYKRTLKQALEWQNNNTDDLIYISERWRAKYDRHGDEHFGPEFLNCYGDRDRKQYEQQLHKRNMTPEEYLEY